VLTELSNPDPDDDADSDADVDFEQAGTGGGKVSVDAWCQNGTPTFAVESESGDADEVEDGDKP
jgi:hypothetical protein